MVVSDVRFGGNTVVDTVGVPPNSVGPLHSLCATPSLHWWAMYSVGGNLHLLPLSQ